jgi:predicted DNA-binding antitoxin AbrB/MazE fold protein
MSHDVDAIYSDGMFRPLEPLVLSDGAHVRLHIVEMTRENSARPFAVRVFSPRLAHPEQAVDFEMEVQEVPDAGL